MSAGRGGASPLPGALVGRDHELALIEDFLARSAVDGGALLLVGEPGVGKTALLHAAAERARARSATVLRASGSPVDSIGLAGLTPALMPLLARADRLPDTHRRAMSVALGLVDDQPPQPAVVSQAVLTMLTSVSADAPILLVVDDLQWLDPYSTEVLGFVAARTAGSRVAVLAASRAAAPGQLAHAGMLWYDVAPLDPAASQELLRSRFPTLAPRVRQRLLDEARGNPLALLELPPALTGRQRAALQDLPGVLPLSERLQAVFAARIVALPAATRDLLLLAALDATADLHVLRAAAGRTVLDDLAPAERERLVHVDDEIHQVLFRHPLTRSAVIELSTAAQRNLAHRALARALAGQPQRQAPHLAAAAEQPDEDVAAQLEKCARHMSHRGDAAGAIAALTRAADLSLAPAERSRRLAEAAQLSARTTWQLTAVTRLLEQAGDTRLNADSALHAAAAAAIAMANGSHDIDTVHRLLVTAIEANARGYQATNDGLLAALVTLSVLCLFGGRPELWQPYEAALARLTPAVPQRLRLQVGTQFDPVRATPAALEELDAAIATLHHETDAEALMGIPAAAVYVDRLAGCRAALRRQISDERGDRPAAQATIARINLCVDAFHSGRWDEAHQLATQVVETSTAAGAALYAQIGTYHLALLAAVRGDADTVRSLTGDIVAWATPRGARLLNVFAWHAQALAAIGRGDFDEAYQNAKAISPPGTFPRYEATALWICLDLVEAAVHTNHHTAAQAHATAMLEHGLPAISSRLALVTYGSAGLATDDDTEALRRFDQALAVPGAERWPFDYARVQLAYGQRLRHTGAIRDARPQLQAALAGFENLGAHPWAARTARQLRATGTRRTTSSTGPETLTAQELEIAKLAASGHTNKQIGARLNLSHRTVSTHLYRIFPKLGITSRAALRDALNATHPQTEDPSQPIERHSAR